MIEQDKRSAVYCLYQEGMNKSKISKELKIDRKTVQRIIDQKGVIPESERCDKIEIDHELLRELYIDCEGWAQRMHEILTEEKGIKIGYSTLTRKLRELELGKKKNQRCDRVCDVAGEEMQHDTTTYYRKIGDKKIRIVASLLYFRYSKVRYLKFYRSFDRFKMKCFIHEALDFYKYCAKICIIDNTNLARLCGAGKNAVIVPEMEEFSKKYGFKFICHEIGHSNRKAGNERSFYTVESNFLPGRTFKNMEDINSQGFDWATKKMYNRPMSKTNLIPAKAFEFEKSYLVKIPIYVTPPYIFYERICDQYGYISVDTNHYWVPGKTRFKAKVFEYSDSIKIYHNRKFLIEYNFPPDGTKNELFSPKGYPKPVYQPAYRKKSSTNEEKKLRGVSEEINLYLNFAIKSMGKKSIHLLENYIV
ncbi:hypothetical protein MHK_003300 [Candidatus Magnetomorum sp. HK-1]|nr:hypothetical protein MHK_003300 [Candidatus Magnetomorum sp. HK-1]